MQSEAQHPDYQILTDDDGAFWVANPQGQILVDSPFSDRAAAEERRDDLNVNLWTIL